MGLKAEEALAIANAYTDEAIRGGGSISYYSYVGDGTRGRVHTIGKHKACIFSISNDTPTTNAWTSFISREVTTYVTFWTDTYGFKNGVGNVTQTDDTIQLNGTDEGQEYNADGLGYTVIIFN